MEPTQETNERGREEALRLLYSEREFILASIREFYKTFDTVLMTLSAASIVFSATLLKDIARTSALRFLLVFALFSLFISILCSLIGSRSAIWSLHLQLQRNSAAIKNDAEINEYNSAVRKSQRVTDRYHVAAMIFFGMGIGLMFLLSAGYLFH